jgi:hypothetical protein
LPTDGRHRNREHYLRILIALGQQAAAEGYSVDAFVQLWHAVTSNRASTAAGYSLVRTARQRLADVCEGLGLWNVACGQWNGLVEDPTCPDVERMDARGRRDAAQHRIHDEKVQLIAALDDVLAAVEAFDENDACLAVVPRQAITSLLEYLRGCRKHL